MANFRDRNSLSIVRRSSDGLWGHIGPLNQQDYEALKALYQSTGGASWLRNTGWRDWNFNSATPPDASIVRSWSGVWVINNRVTSLRLGNNQLTGSIPTELGNLSNLERLHLGLNQLTGSIPTELGNLSNLERLHLGLNQLTGTIPNQLGNLSNLEELWLNNNQLTGTIPTELGNLHNLKLLILHNNQLTGTIPSQLGNLHNLEEFNPSNNQLTGTIPNQLGNLNNLVKLTPNNNQLTGSIPTELGNLSNLEQLYLYNNQLTGSIPTELGNLSNLRYLDLDRNQLTGSIPTELGNLSNLQELDLYNNQLTGSIPSQLGNLSNLQLLYLYNNLLTGTIPQGVLDLQADKRLENPPYVKTEIPDFEFLPGNNLNIDISENFGDINDNINNYTATGLPGGVTINSHGVISGISTTAGIFTVTVTAIDRAGYKGIDTFDIVIKNSFPTDLELSNSSIDENSAVNSVVGTFGTIDPDSGDTFTYQLVSGVGDRDNAAFTIEGNQLLTNSSPDHETKPSYSILIQTTDAAGASYSEAFTINVNDVPESPTGLNLSGSSIDENSAVNSVVGTFSTTDPDSGDSFTYQLVSGAGASDNAAFTIEGNQLLTNSSPDYETKPSYSIRVQTTDAAGASYSETFTINVNDVPESPTSLNLSGSSIDENSAEGAVVGIFSTIDPDSGDTFTYQLVSGAGASDNAAFTISGDQLLINSSPDYETQSSYSIRVQTTDAAGASYSEAFTINVNDVPESPTGLNLSGSSINENSASGSVVGIFSTIDPDSEDTFTYQLVSGAGASDNAAFTISGDQLLINSSPDYETQSSYSIRVQTTDAAGASYSETFTINVNDVPEVGLPIVGEDSQNDYLRGTPNGEQLLGLGGEDRLFGKKGNDTLIGGGGNDHLYGGDRDDSLIGGHGKDYLYGEDENDSLIGGYGNDTIYGEDGNDSIIGGDGDDILYGQDENDTLIGGRGDDTLEGGEDADIFVLKQGHGRDTIIDFEDGTDKIGLAGSLSFNDLQIVSQGQNVLIIGEETLVTLQRIDLTLITSDDFTVVT